MQCLVIRHLTLEHKMKNQRFFINEFIRFANIVQRECIQQKADAFRCREFASCIKLGGFA